MAKKKTTAKRKIAQKAKAGQTKKTLKTQGDLESVKGQLQSLLEKPKTEKKIIELLKTLDASQLRELAPVCDANFNKVMENKSVMGPEGKWVDNPLKSPAQVAIVFTTSLVKLKRFFRWDLPSNELMLEILATHEPSWIEQFVATFLAHSRFWEYWSLCRALVRKRLCPKPDNPRYYIGILNGLCGWRKHNADVLGELRKDPGLFKDEIWRLFEYEGENDHTLATADGWPGVDWAGAFVTLSKEGKLPRAKLLDAALGALEMGFNHHRSRWYFDFFDRMEPTDQELKKRATRILDLMGSLTPNIAQWAFEKQQRLLAIGHLKDASRIINASVPLLGGRHKKTVTQALDLFDRLAPRSTKVAREVCLATVEALGHEKADVQKAAFKLIEKYGSRDDSELRESVEKYTPLAAATVKKQLTAWLSSDSIKEPAKAATKTPSKKATKSKAAFKPSDLKKFDTNHVQLLGLDSLVASLKTSDVSTPIPAATFDGTDIPRLDPDRRIAPIEDFDELLETLGRAMEDENLVDEAERAIAGLARLHADKPDDFDNRIAPLYKRAGKLLLASSQQGNNYICELVHTWKSGELVKVVGEMGEGGYRRFLASESLDEAMDKASDADSLWGFMWCRLLDILKLMLSGRPYQLLSAPTHEGGWIDAETLVARINEAAIEPPETDVIQALLRLAPDGRAAALKKLKPKLKGEWGNAVKHGLGGSGTRVGKSAALWATAARCRSPFKDDSKVMKAFPELGPGAGQAASLETEVWLKEVKRHFDNLGEESPTIAASGIPTQTLPLNMGKARDQWRYSSTGTIRHPAAVWPAAHEAFFGSGALCLAYNLNWSDPEWQNRCFMEPLLDSNVPLLNMGAVLLACGLCSKEPGEHGLAVDIAIAAAHDGRLGTDNLARMITTVFAAEVFTLPRLAKRLQDVASASNLHAYVVLHSLEAALPSIDPKKLPRGFGDLIELMVELSTQLERGVQNEACRSLLQGLKGSNKPAKAAKQLLPIETNFDPGEIIEAAITSRIEHLKQWARNAKPLSSRR